MKDGRGREKERVTRGYGGGSRAPAGRSFTSYYQLEAGPILGGPAGQGAGRSHPWQAASGGDCDDEREKGVR